MSIAISIIAVYLFVLIGYILKGYFKEKIAEQSLVLISVYGLQPILVFWSLSLKTIDKELALVPFIFLLFIVIVALFCYVWGRIFFNEQKDRSILTSSSAINNTANLGVPMAIACFGLDSVIYTGLMIIANIFIIQTLGVYSYSRGEFSIKNSLLNILKLPAFSAAVVAITLNVLNVELHKSLLSTLEMGAFGLMTLQLVLFGIFLNQVQIKEINKKLLLHVNIIKYIFSPLVCIALIYIFNLPDLFAGVLMLLVLTPTAVNNISLAALFKCNPLQVTTVVFVTSVIFIPVLFIFVYILKLVGNSALL
ncbi:MAG: AEC family transporter [Campylobacteraceae bacterium]